MGRTKKTGNKQSKTKRIKKEDLEDLYSDSESDTESETGSETDEDEYELSFDDIKDGDMTLPMFGIGISLIAIVGFAIYKGSAL